MIVAIHQPNFFPYEGVLEKIRQCDVFVLLCHAQFVKGNYHNRFQYDGKWYTLAVNGGIQPLVEKQYCAPKQDWARIKRALADFPLTMFDGLMCPSLVETNVAIIYHLCFALGIRTRLVRDEPTELAGTKRLVDICLKHKATTYLSGASGPTYLDMSLFEAAGIKVAVQEVPPGKRRAAIQLL